MRFLYLCLLYVSASYSQGMYAAKAANCGLLDDNRIRCLSKKRCNWSQGEGKTKGFCTYKNIGINSEELSYYKEGENNKLECHQERKNYKALLDDLIRAKIYNDSNMYKSLEEKIQLKAKDILKIPECTVLEDKIENENSQKSSGDKKNE
jgi:hypothetical protein